MKKFFIVLYRILATIIVTPLVIVGTILTGILYLIAGSFVVLGAIICDIWNIDTETTVYEKD